MSTNVARFRLPDELHTGTHNRQIAFIYAALHDVSIGIDSGMAQIGK